MNGASGATVPMDITVHGAITSHLPRSVIPAKLLMDAIPTISMNTARPSIGLTFGERRAMMYRFVTLMDHGPMWITALVEIITSTYATCKQGRIMNGESGHIAVIIVIAPGLIPIIFPLLEPIVILQIGYNAMISLEILPHGHGVRRMELIRIGYNGVYRAGRGTTFQEDRLPVPGFLFTICSLAPPMNGASKAIVITAPAVTGVIRMSSLLHVIIVALLHLTLLQKISVIMVPH